MHLQFNDLPRVVRERIVKLTNEPADARVLSFEHTWRMGWFRFVMAIAGAGGVAACLQFLFERRRVGIHPRHDQEIFLGLAGALFVLVVAAVGITLRRMYPRPPYREGQFAFASGILKASDGGELMLLPAAQLGRPTLVTVKRNGSYSHSRLQLGAGLDFTFNSNQAAEKATMAIIAAKERFLAAVATRDAQAIAALDPFAECTLSGTWTEPALTMREGPFAARVPKALRLAQWLGGLAFGVVMSAGLYVVLARAME